MAFGIVKICDKDYKFRSSAATGIFYKQVFKKDLLVSLMKAAKFSDITTDSIYSMDDDDIELFLSKSDDLKQLGFIMNKQAEGAESKDFCSMNQIDYYNWLDQFEQIDEQAVSRIVEIYNGGSETEVDEKKGSAAPKE